MKNEVPMPNNVISGVSVIERRQIKGFKLRWFKLRSDI